MGFKGVKRSAPATEGSSKKRKVQPGKQANSQKKSQAKAKGKEKASDKPIIPIPGADIDDENHSDDALLSEEDVDILGEYGNAVAFLDKLDRTGISRSKKETVRLHQLNKPVRKAPVHDDLPSIDSHDEDEDSWKASDADQSDLPVNDMDSDTEMPYEKVPRKRRLSWDSDKEHQIQKLPIKLGDGRIQRQGQKDVPVRSNPEDESDEESVTSEKSPLEPQRDDVATGARFGRPAVVDVVSNQSRKARVQGAKEQIASICQEIISEPENSLGLLRRLHTFSLEKITTPTHPEPVINDVIIRKLAILSQLAVFKDIIPGYRIRALTDKEKAEKVSQMVSRTRDYEQGLVFVYQNYLRSLEAELKVKSELADVALQCICTLATEVTHFNFRSNLITCIVARLSKRSWDPSSDLCMSTLVTIFREDLTGVPSLEVVQLLNRMVKERRFNIHPEVLTCLLHLRLKTELAVRSSDSKANKEEKNYKTYSKGRAAARRAKGKPTDQPHLSKKAQKALKEKKEIQREFRDAEAEVDKEERAKTHTETLKLVFVLYFRVLKNPRPTPLLPAALRGISKFAHLVNIDFFKDLMQVLKGLITRESTDDEDDDDGPLHRDINNDTRDIHHRLLCIVTAFELLSGQGEALNIDLSDFVNHLYAIILPISLLPKLDLPPPSASSSDVRTTKAPSVADMLFRALVIVFSPRTSGLAAPPWRSAAFAKRLLLASLNWPPGTVLRALEFVGGLIAKDPKLEALLSTEDRTYDGIYLPEIDDPQLCHPFGTSFWELQLLQQTHYDARVREAARQLSRYTRS
ncbi:hypothetical protein SERLA73DRAFT_99308 [Serpula lacrymans var. lacrymans S7.3]|uniref:Nucleolar complex-associated protein 3 n=1 Tax=Serpula lacrymans var. lacrymans (strain S7.3) TaxID=936435 RepID=F8QGZ1_SERL3|nr:hypothetical protein SERLA73DRAFT_99308 [Serpula lacrymans var. lacrymans S7.3]